jgi:hypothetical protein
MTRSVNLFANMNKQNQMPVINNQYAVLANFKDPDSGMPKHQQNRDNTRWNKDKGNKLKHKILIIGNSDTRGLATEPK